MTYTDGGPFLLWSLPPGSPTESLGKQPDRITAHTRTVQVPITVEGGPADLLPLTGHTLPIRSCYPLALFAWLMVKQALRNCSIFLVCSPGTCVQFVPDLSLPFPDSSLSSLTSFPLLDPAVWKLLRTGVTHKKRGRWRKDRCLRARTHGWSNPPSPSPLFWFECVSFCSGVRWERGKGRGEEERGRRLVMAVCHVGA